MHTSGSTGHPKVIAWSHDFINSKTKQNADEYPHGKGRVMYTPFPIYHVCSCIHDVIAGYGGINTLVEPNLVASPDSVLRHIRILKDRKPDIFVVPSLLEDVVDTLGIEEALEYLRIPNTVFHGGAPLRRDVGDKLAHGGVRLVTVAGTTETGTVGRLVYDSAIEPSDWQYVKLVEGYTLNFTPVNAEHPDQGYTLVVSPKIMAPPIINHEDPHGFLASDLWMRHPDPSKSHLWKMAGRLDDIIVLSNGEKANGKQLETLLCSSPYVSQAVVFGAGRFLCGVILRPSAKYVLPVDDEGAKQAYLSQVWLYIDTHVNKTVPRHSRLLQPLVLVEDPAHPFQYSDKGTVKKQTTLALYHEQIEQAYQTVEQGQSPSVTNPPSPSFDNVTVFTGLVRSQVSECLERTIGDDDDFFNAGLDSLLAVKLRFSIISALKEANVSEVVPHNVIYVHPTTTSLAHYLWSLIDVSHKAYKSANVSSTHCNEAATATMIEETVARLTSSFPDRTQTCVHDQEGEVYVVTGTTGSLGSAFLSLLLQQPQDQIRKVYCLNRKSSKAMTMRRHEISFEERGLDFGSLKDAVENGRAVLVETDVTKKRIGISVELFAEMAAQATHIVHNAWPVTFTYHFQSFIPHLDGLRTLIDLALASPRSVPPHFTFISSIAVASRLPTPSNDAVIPELPLTSVSHVVQHGYALSKYAAEQILEEATSATPLRASIVRSGQIAGSLSTGAWNSNEYMPGILRACVRSGKVPEDLFSVPLRWLPLEHASKVVYAITQAHGSSSSASLTIYGFENTRPVEWSSIVSSLFTLYPALQKVPTLEWFHSVRALQEGKEGIIDSALLDYIEDFMWRKPMPRLATANVEAISPEVADLVDFDFATNEAVVEKYISYAVHA
ncbi:male sterility protein-domain-containing protein [Cytidiella melzeri]|nr:male sterility protein-domain-containing protein [Cytidiella melzeri]